MLLAHSQFSVVGEWVSVCMCGCSSLLFRFSFRFRFSLVLYVKHEQVTHILFENWTAKSARFKCSGNAISSVKISAHTQNHTPGRFTNNNGFSHSYTVCHAFVRIVCSHNSIYLYCVCVFFFVFGVVRCAAPRQKCFNFIYTSRLPCWIPSVLRQFSYYFVIRSNFVVFLSLPLCLSHSHSIAPCIDIHCRSMEMVVIDPRTIFIELFMWQSWFVFLQLFLSNEIGSLLDFNHGVVMCFFVLFR